jgi:TPR repeat protein
VLRKNNIIGYQVPSAQNELGYFYRHGPGTTPNYTAAMYGFAKPQSAA